jgi:hypothetical protein
MTIFPECDPRCKDVAHFYYGGKNLFYFNKNTPKINIEVLIRNMTIYLKHKYGITHYKRKLVEFAKTTGLGLNENNLLEVYMTDDCAETDFGKISPNLIILPIDSGGILPMTYYAANFEDNSAKGNSAQKIPKNHDLYRSSDIATIRETCKLFREFENGQRWLWHNELYGLAVALIQVETGKKIFLDILLANSHHHSYVDKYNKWVDNLDYFKMNNYKPEHCNNFCPYKDTCQHGKNLLSIIRVKYHHIVALENYVETYYPLAEAEADVREKIKEAVNAMDSYIRVIKAQTAIGKTRIYLELMRDSDRPFLIAVSSNELKHDVYDRALEMDIYNVMKTPSLHELKDSIPRNMWDKIFGYYESGRNHLVYPYIKKILKEYDIPCLEDHLEKSKEVREFKGHIITTHKRLLTMDDETLNRYEIIIDEDIICKAVIPNQQTITIPYLKEMLSKVDPYSKLADKIHRVIESVKKTELFILKSIEYDEEYDDIPIAFDISSFCKAECFCFRKAGSEPKLLHDCISFFKPIGFVNAKYTIVSATVNEMIYQSYFGSDRVKFYSCKEARLRGDLNQYIDKSMSRTDIGDNYKSILKQIENRLGVHKIITFKEYNEYAKLYLGKTEGCDYLKGQNINIIGTQHYPSFLYKLFAFTIGLKFNQKAEWKKNKIVVHNGGIFRFSTYTDDVLKNIQFWLIESELEQAVGRARLLRFDCSVNIFSNFPLRQANLRRFGWEDLRNDSK